MLGWPKRCKLARSFLWEYSDKRLQLAQLLGQLGVLFTLTKIVQGWPKLWANFRALVEIFSQIVGLNLTIWANLASCSLMAGNNLGAVEERHLGLVLHAVQQLLDHLQ